MSADTDDILGLNCGSYLRLSISEPKKGTEPEILDRIFDPSFKTKRLG